MGPTQLAQSFMRFAEMECRESSALYELLSTRIAEDEELLNLCRVIPRGQPVPNLLFAGVQYLLMKGTEHPLKDYYASLTVSPKQPDAEAFILFKNFCLTYRDQLEPLLMHRLVQTNEVRRCAYLYPTFSWIHSQTERPLALIEIGTSAGLQLLWDQYRYDYGTGETFGSRDACLTIRSEVKADRLPFLLPKSPPVASRIGFDLHPSDLSDPDDYIWMKALIWPEHSERRELFDQAAACLKTNPVQLIQGDGIELLKTHADRIPDGAALCVFHTHVANQLPDDTKQALEDTLAAIGEQRELFHIYNNMHDTQLHLDHYENGTLHPQTIGSTDGHGRWFEWRLAKTH